MQRKNIIWVHVSVIYSYFLILIFKPAILTLYNGLLRARVTAGY